MKKIFTILTTFVLSVIITIAGLGFYVYKYNPFNIQACLISSFLSVPTENTATDGDTAGGSTEKFDHPLLSEEQEAKLESAGIDVSALPTVIPPEAEECAVKALGEDRVNEIINGAIPGPLDLFRAKSCF